MSEYTTQVRYICEHEAGLIKSAGGNSVDEIIEKAREKIFGDFTIFDENYRPVLEAKILKHYYTREIGLETPGLWILKLNTKLEEIMPYYNKMYSAYALDVNPLDDTSIKREHDESGENNSTADASSTNLYSDTPQGGIEGLNENGYLTNANKNTSTNGAVVNTTNKYVETLTGKQGGKSYGKAIREYVDSLINIDMKIISDLSDLFMNIY